MTRVAGIVFAMPRRGPADSDAQVVSHLGIGMGFVRTGGRREGGPSTVPTLVLWRRLRSRSSRGG
jgi:hypothetical protein